MAKGGTHGLGHPGAQWAVHCGATLKVPALPAQALAVVGKCCLQ